MEVYKQVAFISNLHVPVLACDSPPLDARYILPDHVFHRSQTIQIRSCPQRRQTALLISINLFTKKKYVINRSTHTYSGSPWVISPSTEFNRYREISCNHTHRKYCTEYRYSKGWRNEWSQINREHWYCVCSSSSLIRWWLTRGRIHGSLAGFKGLQGLLSTKGALMSRSI